MEKHSVSRLIGSPPGYVGYEDGGQLTEKVRRKPWSVVLFDEIEKAHEDVWGILLQIMDDGVLTDSAGRRVDFSNTLVVMTSNVGAKSISQRRSPLGFAPDGESDDAAMKTQVMAELKSVFRPEFLNRLDETVIFRRLNNADMLSICAKLVDAVSERFTALGIELSVPEDALRALVEMGSSESYGARALRRTVQTQLVDTAAQMLLEGSIAPGDQVTALAVDGCICFEKSHAAMILNTKPTM
jgi:ATP-dependent Clp protease ATP-binding subunit ClpC